MKSKYWLILFIIDVVLHLATTIYSLPVLLVITKPLLMILLGGYFISILGSTKNNLKTFILIALGCSWLGDTFLMLQVEKPLFFILGLSSFLLAHVAYILSFRKFETVLASTTTGIISILFGLYAIVLSFLLWPGLGGMKIPVIAYAIVLTLMGIMGVIKSVRINNLIVVGVVLFIVSDSLIAYTKFVEPINYSRFLIMSTYILAQFLIIKGLSKRIVSG